MPKVQSSHDEKSNIDLGVSVLDNDLDAGRHVSAAGAHGGAAEEIVALKEGDSLASLEVNLASLLGNGKGVPIDILVGFRKDVVGFRGPVGLLQTQETC